MNRFKNIKFDRKLVIKLILLSPLIAILVYGFLIRPVQVRLEQREFKKAEVFLEEKKNEIERLVGPAGSVEKQNSCGYSSAKFSKGDLGCGSRINYFYRVNDLNEANRKVAVISEVGDSVIYRLSGKADGFTEDDIQRGIKLEQSLAHDSLNCSLDYQLTKDGEALLLNVYTGCGGQAMTEMYPVRE